MRRRALLRLAGLGAGLGSASALASGGPGRAGAQEGGGEFAPLGSLAVPGTKEGVVGPEGRYAFLAVTDGFAVVDLADPASPELVFENRSPLSGRENGPLRMVYDVKHDPGSDLLAVVGPANPVGGDAFNGLVTYDVSDPTAPSRVAVHETPFFNHNCDVEAGVVYLCGNDGQRNALVAVDGETGERLGSWSVVSVDERWSRVRFGNWVLHDLSVSDGIAYLAHWDAGTWMVDVSDPTDPSLLGRVRGRGPEVFLDMADDVARRENLEPPGNDHFAARGPGDVLGISVESWASEGSDSESRGGAGSVHLYDVSDPTGTSQLAELEPPPTEDATYGGTWTTSHNFEFDGDLLFTSWYGGGVKVHDVSDPEAPVELAHWRDESRAWFWTAQAATPEFFVATSLGSGVSDTQGRSEDAGVYTFPVVESAGTPSPTPTSAPSPTPEGSGSPPSTTTPVATPDPTPTATPEPTDTRTPSPTATGTETPTATDTETASDPGTTTGEAPGFGAGVGALGLGLGLRRYLQDPGEDED
ncbi:MAG: hypothetical protein V5A62_11905 [Haloarculaceae archaeon]